MPKILENVKEQIIAEAKKEVLENGYSEMTIRSVAKACNIATGTVYNYFASKEMLVAAFMAEDWSKMVASITAEIEKTQFAMDAVRIMYDGIVGFIGRYVGIFKDESAEKSYRAAVPVRHKMLCIQLVQILDPICKKCAREYTACLSEFIVEAMLTWTMDNKNKEEFCKIVNQFFE